MSREPIILITGANGEVGHGLIEYLAAQEHTPEIVVFDLKPLDEALRPLVKRYIVGDVLDNTLLDTLHHDYEIDTIYHLAALLSTSGEKFPEKAHEVNVQGTVKLLHMAVREGQTRGRSVKFIYPSSIAAYGLPNLKAKHTAGAVNEDAFLMPTTMYGVNKLYGEHVGRYYANHYMQLTEDPAIMVDFRSLRFPGLISAFTVPSGGTSDYAPEMIHAAAQELDYTCFVRPDTMIPFMAMPDGIQALLQLAEAPREALTRQVYNVAAFSARADQIAELVQAEFPGIEIDYDPHPGRQGIVDTWPEAVDDSAAQEDWGWQPDYDMARTFDDYLFPNIRQRYLEMA